jgi:hypothetical protein
MFTKGILALMKINARIVRCAGITKLFTNSLGLIDDLGEKGVAMKILSRYLSHLTLAVTSVISLNAWAASDPEAAKQMTEDFSPQAQYKLAMREAQAAYQDAVTNCKSMKGVDRTSCMKEARSNLQADLSTAKKARSSGQ